MSGGDVWRKAVMAGLVSVLALAATAPPASCSPSNSHYSGQSALQKRAHRNFLRFGRGGALLQSLENPYNSGSYSPVYDKLDEAVQLNPALADVWAATLAANKNFLRFGPELASKNFIRFGRGDGPAAKNFLRFGRSISRDDTASTDRFLEEKSSKQLPRNKNIYFGMITNPIGPGEGSSRNNVAQKNNSQPERMRRSIASADQKFRSASTNHQGASHLRMKRSPLSLYLVNAQSGLYSDARIPYDDDMSGFSYGDGSSREEDEDLSSSTIQEIQKRAFPLNFSRFGREPSDLNFLRFGKRVSDEEGRDSSESGSHEMSIAGLLGSAENMEAVLRAKNNRNFLRYGRR